MPLQVQTNIERGYSFISQLNRIGEQNVHICSSKYAMKKIRHPGSSINTSDTLSNKTKTRKKTLLNHSAGQSVVILTRLLKCPGPQLSSSWSPVISNLQTSFSTTTLLILTQTWLELGCLQQEKYIKDYGSHQRTLRHTAHTYSILKSLRRNSYSLSKLGKLKIVCIRYN